MTRSISHSDDLEGTRVVFNVNQLTDSAGVISLGDHNSLSYLELKEVYNFVGSQVHLDGVIHSDERVGVSDGSAIVGADEGDLILGKLKLVHSAELEAGFLLRDSVEHESAFHIVQKSEEITALLDIHDIHEANRVSVVSSGLTIDLDVLLHADHLDFLARQSISKSISKDEDHRHALSQLVGTIGGSGSPDTVHLAEHPVLGGNQSF